MGRLIHWGTAAGLQQTAQISRKCCRSQIPGHVDQPQTEEIKVFPDIFDLYYELSDKAKVFTGIRKVVALLDAKRHHTAEG